METNKESNFFLRLYFKIFNSMASKGGKSRDIDPNEIHAHLIAIFPSSILMWTYTCVALYFFEDPVPGLVCLFCSLVFTGMILFYRYISKPNVFSNVLLTVALIEILTYSYYSGGFRSYALVWIGIFPLLGGMAQGIKGAIFWLLGTTVIMVVFTVLYMTGYEFPVHLIDKGYTLGKALTIFGWLVISTVFIITFIERANFTSKILQKQNQKIEDLFRVLFHDLANPLGRLTIGITLAKKKEDEAISNRGLDIAKEATDSMLEITQNIRKIYATRKGKVSIASVMTPLNEAVTYLQSIYATDLERKRLRLEYNFEKNHGFHVFVEPVSFKNQVLGNIVCNSIKFSPEGETILISVYPFDQHNYAVEIKDNGIGMSKALIASLYDLSKKTSRPGTKGEAGTGFGMYIMKSYMDMYQGQVLIDSAEGGPESPSGTTVKLILKGEWK